MKEYSMYVLGIRLLAIYIISKGIILLPQLAFFTKSLVQDDWLKFVLAIVTSIIAPLIIGIILWVIAKRIATKMLPSSDNIEISYDSNLQLAQVLIAVAGFMLVVTALPDLLYQIAHSFYDEESKNFWLTGIFSSILKVLLGVCLVMGQKGLSSLILKLRGR